MRKVCIGFILVIIQLSFYFFVLFWLPLFFEWRFTPGPVRNNSKKNMGPVRVRVEATAKVQNLKKVREVVATGHAFAALLEDGDVVTWGHIVTWKKRMFWGVGFFCKG